MKSISAEKCCSVVSLLNEGHSHHQIQVRTGLGKGTIGRISKEVEGGKENHPGGCPSKLSPCDKQSIFHQISSGIVFKSPVAGPEKNQQPNWTNRWLQPNRSCSCLQSRPVLVSVALFLPF